MPKFGTYDELAAGGVAADDLVLVKDTSATATKKVQVQNLCHYKKYVALLTQSGTDAPVATVLENSLGGTVVWTRNDVGVYIGTLAGAFTANKTFALGNALPDDNSEPYVAAAYRVSDDEVYLKVMSTGSSYSDNNSITLTILVYP